jgi:hypothetical protein
MQSRRCENPTDQIEEIYYPINIGVIMLELIELVPFVSRLYEADNRIVVTGGPPRGVEDDFP